MTGRYIAADPLGLGGGSNLCAYAGGDPINAVDTEGLQLGQAALFSAALAPGLRVHVMDCSSRHLRSRLS
jgi:uncharacterized protein RhaS with RHS repeats